MKDLGPRHFIILFLTIFILKVTVADPMREKSQKQRVSFVNTTDR
jgi:hypothetical protein